nr:hypothetical protein PF009_g26130 [Phytophthora fragariae]
MNFRAFGEPYPGEAAKPVCARSSTLAYAKKAISCFVPRVAVQWDPIRKEGNPTRSELVNKVIKTVKRFEVRRQGVQSAARRPIEYEEFVNLLTLVRAAQGKGALKYVVSSVLTLQWHMITRIDDMMQLKFESFSPNVQHPRSLLCQLRWSKNISEERDAPEQILLGSLDPPVCVLLNLAVHVEMTTAGNSSYVFGSPQDGDRVVRRFLQDMFGDEAFHKLKDGNLGTHSLRKGAATYATRSGLPKDYINRRGRWRTQKSIVDVYIDNAQPYPDAVAATVLTGPLGPCFYVIKEGMKRVSDDLLVNQISSVIKQKMGRDLARELGVVLLWASLVPDGTFNYELLPPPLNQRVVTAYRDAGGNVSVNPVKRVPVQVTGEGAQLQLIELHEANDISSTAPAEHRCAQNGISADTTRKEFSALHSQLFGVQRQVANMMNEIFRLRTDMQRELQRTQAVLRRIALQPVARTVLGHDATAAVSHDALPEQEAHRVSVTLAKRPRDLFELWHEFEFGLNGGKPAKEFTRAERGANKFAYSRRKVFWDIVTCLVRAGFTSDTAIDKIYAVYGRQRSVTAILVALRQAKKRGGHPSLRV